MGEAWRESFFEQAAALRGRGGFEPLVVLASSNRLGADLRNELHRRFGGWLGAYTLTFIDLATRLVTARGHARPLAPPEFLHALAVRLVDEMPAGPFDRVREFAGTPGALLATFEDLAEAGWARLPLAKGDSPKLDALDALYRRFRGLVDDAGYDLPGARIAGAADAASGYERALGTRRLHVVGFYDVNPTQAALLGALEKVIDVRYHVPPVPEASGFAVRLAQRVRGIEPKCAPRMARPTDRAWSCPDRVAEVREIAREVRATLDAGVDARSVAVVLRHPDAYRDLIVTHFAEFGIPLRLSGGRRPDESASVRLCATFVRLAADVDRSGQPLWLRSETAAFLAAAMANRGPGAHRWVALSRRARLRRPEDWDRRLAAIAAGEIGRGEFAAEDRRDASDLRDAWIELRRAVEAIRRAATYAEATEFTCAAVRELIPDDSRMNDVLERIRAIRHADEAGLRFDADHFIARAGEAIAAVATRDGVDAHAGVQVIDTSAARGTAFAHVFMPGCVEGEIPYIGREDPILLDADRDALNRRVGAGERLPVFAERVRNERNLFDLAIRSAENSLTLTWPRREAGGGRAVAPSPFLVGMFTASMSLDDFHRSPGVSKYMTGYAATMDERPRTGIEHDVAAARVLEAERPGLSSLYLQRVAPGFELRLGRQRARFGAREWTAHDGMCASPDVVAALRDDRRRNPKMRVTDVEKYAQCPRAFLLLNTLRLASESDADDALSLDALEQGVLLHRALAVAAADGSFDAAQSCLKIAYDELAATGRAAYGILAEYELATLTRRLRALRVASAEWSADAERLRAEETLEFVASDDAILRGRIDRIEEISGGAVRVIDFKTGRAGNTVIGGDLVDDDFNAGQTLQLPVYARALLAQRPDLAGHIECEYRYLKDAKGSETPVRVRFSAEALAQRIDTIDAVIAGIRDDNSAGVFVPRADVAVAGALCEYCDARRICDGVSRARAARIDATHPAHPWRILLTGEGADEIDEAEDDDA
ncbi:MAG: PD-(D/E)XK nuclease family protein [Deltaproteobacteria bacterium]|nr:PD-(D/E)XK nuclease family protein [Deltaproteobacteria bacterium]